MYPHGIEPFRAILEQDFQKKITLTAVSQRSYYFRKEVRHMKLVKGLLYVILIAFTGGIAAAAVMFWYRLKEDDKETT